MRRMPITPAAVAPVPIPAEPDAAKRAAMPDGLTGIRRKGDIAPPVVTVPVPQPTPAPAR
jgi:hypothetical protein